MPTADGLTILGIDPSSTKLAIVVGDSRGLAVKDHLTVKLSATDRPSACKTAYDATLNVLMGQHHVAAVCLEEPVMGRGGPGSTIPQAMISGAIQAAVAQFWALGNAWNEGAEETEFYLANNQSWKKAVLGKGGGDKDFIADWVKENEPVAFSQFVTPRGLVDQDLCDALCIYRYGVRKYRLSQKIKKGLARRGTRS
jgi:Holliday junction resolvasome RuvABC endonuclease subunit